MRCEDEKGLATSNAGARSVSHGLRDAKEDDLHQRRGRDEVRRREGASDF